MSNCANKKYIDVLINNGYTRGEIEDMAPSEIKRQALDIEDTSDMHPNETLEEFLEHENFE